MTRFYLYLLRWQLSTPILWYVLKVMLPYTDELTATMMANLIGGCIFFWIDKLIFKKPVDKQK